MKGHLPLALALAFLLPAAACAQSRRPTAAADQLAAARADAERIIGSLESRQCPALGDRAFVAGANDDAVLAQAAARELAAIDGMIGTLRQVSQDGGISEAGRLQLFALGSWTIAAAAGRLSLLRLAEQARAEPLVEAGRPHPLVPALAHRQRLEQLLQIGLQNEAAAGVQRIAARFDLCRRQLASAVLTANEPAIRTAIAAARESAELRGINARFQLEQDGDGLPVTTAYRDRLRILTDAEARQARLAASRRPAAPPPPVVASGPTPAQMATARRFVDASNQGNEAASLAELADNIVLETPEGTFRGKAEVREAVRRQSANGRKGSMDVPVINGDRVIARGRVGAFPVTSRFEFNSSNKISRITVG